MVTFTDPPQSDDQNNGFTKWTPDLSHLEGTTADPKSENFLGRPRNPGSTDTSQPDGQGQGFTKWTPDLSHLEGTTADPKSENFLGRPKNPNTAGADDQVLEAPRLEYDGTDGKIML